ncbi:MAG: hypothetical protein ABSD99_00065 [Candidatus Bathyarchaeia archaeon]
MNKNSRQSTEIGNALVDDFRYADSDFGSFIGAMAEVTRSTEQAIGHTLRKKISVRRRQVEPTLT